MTQAESPAQKPNAGLNARFLARLLGKSLVLFVILNLLYAVLNPLPLMGKVTLYNSIFPGRERLPYGENPTRAYNLNLYQLDAMMSSHAVARPKAADEFRVILIGDSATWGYLLTPAQTLCGYLNQEGLTASDGRKVRFYNLGYPTMSLTKDLLILSRAMAYQPDAILWPVTLESFPRDKQLASPIVQNNAEAVKALIQSEGLDIDLNDPNLATSSFWDTTIIGQRRALADWLRLQLYGVLWAATGIDQEYPENYTVRKEDFGTDEVFHNLKPPHLSPGDLQLDVLDAGVRMADSIPIIIINEPMFISSGQNSQIRYNFYYPRWAYDDYRKILTQRCEQNKWRCVDLWNAVDATEFTNSALHVTPAGSKQYTGRVVQALKEVID